MALQGKYSFGKNIYRFSRLSFDTVKSNSNRLLYSTVSTRDAPSSKEKKISQAMRAYLARAKEHNEFMSTELAEFELGKRHLANIMGVEPNNMSENDIDRAIEYLLPSGLHDKKARPIMKHPSQVIPAKKSVAFGEDGRPFHHLFYTITYNYYQCSHDVAEAYTELNNYEDQMNSLRKTPFKVKPLILSASEWISKERIEDMIQEKISDDKYEHLLVILERLSQHPYAARKSDFIMKFRKPLVSEVSMLAIPTIETDAFGREYTESHGERKAARATVKVFLNGSGNVNINGSSLIDYFPFIIDRQQIMFPLIISGLLRKVDIEASVDKGGTSGRAGAIRLAISRCLQSSVDTDTCNKMRLSGLLTQDPRRRERKKPGQKGARAKFTWKKR